MPNESSHLNGDRLPAGIKITEAGNIRIRWFHKGIAYSKTLRLPATPEGVSEAADIRRRNIYATRRFGKWSESRPEPPSSHDQYAAVFKAARRRKPDYSLSACDERELVVRAQGHCELTGIPFCFDRKIDGWSRRPYAPSLDRIDSAEGYKPSNVRLVCVAANLAMNQWGEDVLVRVAEGLISKRHCRVEALLGSEVDASA